MGRAPCCDKTKVKRGPWSPEEDVTLKNYVEKYGTGGNWIALPHKAGLRRCGKSCRLRWLNYLRPDIKHGGFTEEEDNIIVALYRNIGSRWSVIASQLPGRTDNDVKNYWNTKLKKKLISLNSTFQTNFSSGNTMDFGMEAPPPPPPPNCYGNSSTPSLVLSSDALVSYHEIERINNNNNNNNGNSSRNSGMQQECGVSELMFHDDESSNISIDNNGNNNLLPLPKLMEVQENGAASSYNNNSCCFMTTSSPPSSYSIGVGTTSTANYAAAVSSSTTSLNWSDNSVMVGEEILGFLVEFGSNKVMPHSTSCSLSSNNSYALLNVNGFDYQEKLLIGTDDDDQEIHIPTGSSSTGSNMVSYSYSSTSTTFLANISENDQPAPAAGLRHHQN